MMVCPVIPCSCPADWRQTLLAGVHIVLLVTAAMDWNVDRYAREGYIRRKGLIKVNFVYDTMACVWLRYPHIGPGDVYGGGCQRYPHARQ